MPYKNKDELPKSVKGHLPPHAQEIYQNAFNSAWGEYKNPEKRYEGSSQEETAHRVAWAAVKQKYEKKGNKWVKKRNT